MASSYWVCDSLHNYTHEFSQGWVSLRRSIIGVMSEDDREIECVLFHSNLEGNEEKTVQSTIWNIWSYGLQSAKIKNQTK